MNSSANTIRVKGGWAHFFGRKLCCSIGRGGIRADKKEGDGATPLGNFSLMGILLRPDRINSSNFPTALHLRRFDVWSDDPLDEQYNHMIPLSPCYPWSHECLWRSDHMYDLIIPVTYNWPNPVAGAGSAIFLHIWRSPRRPTEGCIAFGHEDLLWIASNINCHTQLKVEEA